MTRLNVHLAVLSLALATVRFAGAQGTSLAVLQPPLQRELAQRFRRDLESLVAAAPGVVGVSIEDLTSGERFAVNDSLSFPTASAIKVPLLIELFRQSDMGILKLGARVELRPSDRAGGDGVAQFFSAGGSALSLRDLAVLVSTLSDNTATNVLIDRVGMARVNTLLDSLSLSELRLRRAMIRPAESARGNENVATPRSAARLMVRLANCDLPLRRATCDDLRRLLELPKRGTVSDVVTDGTPLAWKPGTLDGVSTAFALVRLRGRPYVMAVMVSYAGSHADDVVRSVVRLTHAYFVSLASVTPYGVHVSDSLLGPVDSVGRRVPP